MYLGHIGSESAPSSPRSCLPRRTIKVHPTVCQIVSIGSCRTHPKIFTPDARCTIFDDDIPATNLFNKLTLGLANGVPQSTIQCIATSRKAVQEHPCASSALASNHRIAPFPYYQDPSIAGVLPPDGMETEQFRRKLSFEHRLASSIYTRVPAYFPDFSVP
jgi:hypothetical protein